MNLDTEKLTELLQKRYNIPLKELNHIYELSEAQTDKGGQAEVQVMPKIAEIDFGINELENIKDYLDDNDIYFVNQRIAELEKKKSNFTA